MLELGRVHVFSVFDGLFGALHGVFDRLFVDFIFGDGALGENGDFVAGDLGKTTADSEE